MVILNFRNNIFINLILFNLFISLVFAENSNEIFLILGHAGSVDSYCISKDGKYIVSTGSKTVKLWDVNLRRVIRTFYGQENGMSSVFLSTDNRLIVSSNSNSLKVWEVNSGKLLHTIKVESNFINRTVVLSPDDKFIAFAKYDETIELWNVNSGKLIKKFMGNTEYINSLSFSPDCRQIASGSDDKTIKIWEIASGKLIKTIKIHYYVRSVSFSPNGKQIAASRYYERTTLFNVDTGKKIRTIQKASYFAYNNSGNKIATSDRKTIKVYDTAAGKLLKLHPNKENYCIASFHFNKSDQLVVLCKHNNTLTIWKPGKSFKKSVVLKMPESDLCVNISNDDKLLTSSGVNNSIKVYNFTNGKLIKNTNGNKFQNRICTLFPHLISSDSKQIIFGINSCYHKSFKLYCTGIYSENILKTFNLNTHIDSLAMSTDGQYLAAGDFNSNIHIWNLIKPEHFFSKSNQKGKQYIRAKPGGQAVKGIDFTHDNRYLVAGDEKESVMVWDVRKGELFRYLQGLNYDVYSVSCSPKNYFVAFGGREKTIRLWDFQSDKIIRVYRGHTDFINSVSFSPDATFIASGSSDKTIKIWDANSDKLIKTLKGHRGSINSICFTSDSLFLASRSADNTIRIWNMKTYKTKMIIPVLPGNEWLVLKPDSLDYNSSPNGDKYAEVRFNNNNSVRKPLSDYRNKHKKSDLFALPPVVNAVKPPKRQILPPTIHITSPDSIHYTKKSEIPIHIKLDEQASPITKINIFVNNKEIKYQKAPNRILDPIHKSIQQYYILLPHKKNIIRVTATNEDNLTSFDSITVYREMQNLPKPEGILYLISVGVNKLYHLKGNDLDYAANDAIDFARLMKVMKGKLYSDVKVYTYSDKSKEQPTSDIIENALYKYLKHAKKEDTVMIFLAGHGKSISDNQYIFLTRDARQDDNNDYMMSTVLKWSDINDALKNLSCRKVMILDTCYTGGIDIREQFTKGFNNNIIIFTSTKKGQMASECKQYENGCFTYAIEKGLGNNLFADLDKDNIVKITEMELYVSNELKKLTNNQQPDIILPAGGSGFILYVQPEN